MTRLALLLLLVAAPARMFPAGQSGYAVEELRDERATTLPPFSISRVAPFSGGLRLFLRTDSPEAVAGLLAAGALETQLSDHAAGSANPVPMSFGVAVSCAGEIPTYQTYSRALPLCGRETPATIEYFFEVAVTLGADRDLAIGQDPDFLWLIEER